MTSQPATEPTIEADTADHYRGVLHKLVDLATNLAQLVHDQAHIEAAQPRSESRPDFTAPFERVARTIRRCILLDRKLAEPLPAARDQTQQRKATRERIIRDVEDVIQRGFSDEPEEILHAELLERMDGPDIAEAIDNRPVAEIILDICRDLGMESMPGNHPWTRRTPADIAILRARAAGIEIPTGPPANGSGRPLPLSDEELVDRLLHGAARCR